MYFCKKIKHTRMNKITYTLIFLCFCLLIKADAQKQPIKLIMRGDDMGFSHAANEALIKSYKLGIETSIEIIVPAPWFLEGVKLLKQNPSVDVGVHLCLTSEWDNLKWRPMTDGASLRDSNGYLFPKIYPDKNYVGQSVMESKYSIYDIEKEFRAQIETAKRHIPRISHISGHMNCTGFNDEVKALTKRLAKEYNLLTDYTLEEAGVKRMSYDGEHRTALEKFNSFKKAISKLDSGKTYLFLDHPAFDNDEIRAVHHIGYKDVAEDRQGVTDLFTNETMPFLLQERGIELISYADWLRQQNFPKTVDSVFKMPLRDNLWVFILAGQSNMAGRGFVEPQDTVSNKRLLTIDKNFQLVYAKEPLHFYEPHNTGLDCGISFGHTLLQNVPDNVSVLLIPTAVGGSSIQQWLADSVYRDVKLMSNFKEKVKFANIHGVIKGILWHQGESNTSDTTDIRLHPERLAQLFKIFRNIAHNDKLPILAAELGSFSNNKNWQLMNGAIKEAIQKDANAALIPTQDLKNKGDNIHFNSEGQRSMGERFAREYLKMKR
jgi:chitin disaccharide deacetylase